MINLEDGDLPVMRFAVQLYWGHAVKSCDKLVSLIALVRSDLLGKYEK